MYAKLFAERGLSLDRLRALLEVAAAGSIVRAAQADPVRQSQYSRQIKELEEFFRVQLIERQGRGTRLTQSGRELTRISRFFVMGLANFQRGCLAEAQAFSLGAGATFLERFLLPALAEPALRRGVVRYGTEVCTNEEVERRLHDLTLDFGVVSAKALSRPLQVGVLANWEVVLWVPRALHLSGAAALKAFRNQTLPLALARRELPEPLVAGQAENERAWGCESFLQACALLNREHLAALLPVFLVPENPARFLSVALPKTQSGRCGFYLAWNPRLLRLNPHAVRTKELLAQRLSAQLKQGMRQ